MMKKEEIKSNAILLTQYERVGSVGMEEVKELWADEYFEPADYLSEYNEYLAEQGYDGYFQFDELDELLEGYSPIDIIRMWHFGDNNNSFMDEYFTFNGYGNIRTCTEYEVIQEIKEDPDFYSWLVDNNYIEIDEEEAQEIIEEANELIKQGY